MAEMLVASWLSCCKPHSPGRVNPTFKPKPRYRQPGQQQWHISTYPKTKCPSFVCNPHSGNSASQQMEFSLGGLRGFELVLCTHLTGLDCLKGLRWWLLKVSHSTHIQIFSFSAFLIYPGMLFAPLSLSLTGRSPRSLTSKWATIVHQQHHFSPIPCESCSDRRDLL